MQVIVFSANDLFSYCVLIIASISNRIVSNVNIVL